jgi:hypothetical protein
MPVCASGPYCFCPKQQVQRKHPCKICGHFLHGGPCSFSVEGEFSEAVAFYCVKCAHSEKVTDNASAPAKWPQAPSTPVRQQQQQNDGRQSPNNRQHSSSPSSSATSPGAYSYVDESSPQSNTSIDYSAVSSPKKRSAGQPLTAASPQGRKRLKQSLLGHFTSFRTYEVREFDLLDQKYLDVKNAANEGTELSMDYEKEDKVARLVTELDDLRRQQPRPEGFFQSAATLQNRLSSLQSELKPTQHAISKTMNILEESNQALHIYERASDFNTCMKWEKIYLAAKQVLAPHLKHQQRKIEMQAAAKANATAQKGVARKAAAKDQTIVGTGEGAASVAVTLITPPSKVMVEKNGLSVPLDDILKPMEPAARSRGRVMKKKSVRTKAASSSVAARPAAAKERRNNSMTPGEFAHFLTVSWTNTSQHRGTKVIRAGANKLGHGLSLLDGGCLHCSLCNTAINEKKKTSQHLASVKHHQKFTVAQQKKAAPKYQQTVPRLQKQQEERGLSGQTISLECKRYRMEGLYRCYFANMSLGMLDRFKSFAEMSAAPGLTIGAALDLPRTVGRALIDEEMEKLRDIMTKCFPQFGTISDGTPVGVEAEAVKIRMVTRDFRIIELLVSVSLFKFKLNGVAIANNLLNIIKSKCSLDPGDWRTAMMDRASTNKKAIAEIKATTDYRPTTFPCMSHTLCKPGESFDAPEAEAVRKQYNKAIMFRGKAAAVVKECFNEPVKVAGGIRWWNKYEQVEQMDRFQLDQIMERVVPECIEKKYSEKSIAKLGALATHSVVPKIMVQMATVAEVGRPFCQATYTLEGDDPLALTAYLVFERLDDYAESGVRLKRTKNVVCQRAVELIDKLRQPFLTQVARLKTAITNAENDIADIEDDLNANPGVEEDAPEPTRRRVRTGTPRFRGGMDAPIVPPNGDELKAAQLTAARDRLKKAGDSLAEKQTEIELLDSGLGPTTKEEFVQYGKGVAQAALEKYKKLFQVIRPPGTDITDLMRAKRSFQACKVFDTLYLATDPPMEVLYSLVDDLEYFDYPEFDEEFRADLKKEIPEAIQLAKGEFDWEALPGSKQYRQRVLGRARREQHRIAIANAEENTDAPPDAAIPAQPQVHPNDIGNYDSWQEDAGERSRRIWEWWRAWFLSGNKFLKIRHAMRLIVLAQPSSAATERVFSQLQFIRRVCGDAMLEDVLCMRTMVRCNHGLCDDFEL